MWLQLLRVYGGEHDIYYNAGCRYNVDEGKRWYLHLLFQNIKPRQTLRINQHPVTSGSGCGLMDIEEKNNNGGM